MSTVLEWVATVSKLNLAGCISDAATASWSIIRRGGW